METITAVYDGKVFVPDEPVDLEPNARVRVVMDRTPAPSRKERQAAFERLRQNAGHGGASSSTGATFTLEVRRTFGHQHPDRAAGRRSRSPYRG